METNIHLEHLLNLARQGGAQEATQSERKARRILEALMSETIGLDDSAIAGIGEAARLIGEQGFDGVDRLRDVLDPQSPENGGAHFLDLRHEPSGLRHYLDSRPVRAGDLIEVWIGSVGWESARYEWSFRETSSPTAWFAEDEGITIKDDTPLRWPSEGPSV